MFFNSHIHKGREIGNSVRALLSSACLGTGWFDDGDLSNSVPKSFFEDLYIRGFITSMCGMMMNFQLGGQNWSLEKKGACIKEAFKIIDPSGQFFQLHITTTASLADEPQLINGREAATTLFGVMNDKLRLDDPDPLLARAKQLSDKSKGQIDLNFAVFKLAIWDYVKENFPEENEVDEFEGPWSKSTKVASEVISSLDDNETATCPFCAEDIKSKAVKCKHCGEWLDGR